MQLLYPSCNLHQNCHVAPDDACPAFARQSERRRQCAHSALHNARGARRTVLRARTGALASAAANAPALLKHRAHRKSHLVEPWLCALSQCSLARRSVADDHGITKHNKFNQVRAATADLILSGMQLPYKIYLHGAFTFTGI